MKLNDEAEAKYRVQSYGDEKPIDGVTVHDLRRHRDDGGSMTELARLWGGKLLELDGFQVAQINVATVAPGAIKAFHVHRRQTDVWFVPPEDRVLLVLVDVRDGTDRSMPVRRIVLGDGESRLVRIPPGVAHGCRNIGSGLARVVYFCDLHFSPEPDETDEGRLPWDLAGEAVWEVFRD